MAVAVAVLAAAGAVAIVVSPAAAIIAKSVVDPIAHATSAGAALYVLAFVTASTFACTRLAIGNPGVERRLGWILVAALAVGGSANVAGHLAFADAHAVPTRTPFYVWNGDENTYSFVLHSHAGKSALSAVLAPVATTLGLDVGQAWGDRLPAWVGFVCAAALIVALTAYLLLLPHVAQGRTRGRWLALLLGLAALNASKAIIDGGLLTYRGLPALVVVAWVALAPWRSASRATVAGWIVATASALAAHALAWDSAAANGAGEAPSALGTLACLFAIPALLALGEGRGVRRVLRAAALCVFGVLAALGGLRTVAATAGRLLLPLPHGYVAAVTHPRAASAPRPVAGATALAVYGGAGENPLKPRALLLRSARPLPPRRFTFVVIGLDAGVAALPSPAPWQLTLGPPLPGRSDARFLVITAAGPAAAAFAADEPFARDNYYCMLHALAAQVRTRATRFLVVPVRDSGDLEALVDRGALVSRVP